MYTKLRKLRNYALSWVVCYYPVSVKRRLRTIVFTMQMSTLYMTTIAPLFSNPQTIVRSQSAVSIYTAPLLSQLGSNFTKP